MPSPFPGMDPYLEGSLWMSVHTQLASEIARQLNRQIRPRYVALSTRRFVMDDPEEEGHDRGEPPRCRRPQATAGRTGQPGRGDPRPTAPDDDGDADSGASHHGRDPRRRAPSASWPRSRSSRRPTSEERDVREYLEARSLPRQRRPSARDRPAPKGTARADGGKLPPAPYFVFLSRADQRPLTEVWPITLDQPLPEVPVPLLPGDADAKLDLQRALTIVYDECGLELYDRLSKPPRCRSPPNRPPGSTSTSAPRGCVLDGERRRPAMPHDPSTRLRSQPRPDPPRAARAVRHGVRDDRPGGRAGRRPLAGLDLRGPRRIAHRHPGSLGPMAPKSPHFPGKAKQVVHLFMNGGPSQVDTFDPKPMLAQVPRQDPARARISAPSARPARPWARRSRSGSTARAASRSASCSPARPSSTSTTSASSARCTPTCPITSRR